MWKEIEESVRQGWRYSNMNELKQWRSLAYEKNWKQGWRSASRAPASLAARCSVLEVYCSVLEVYCSHRVAQCSGVGVDL